MEIKNVNINRREKTIIEVKKGDHLVKSSKIDQEII